MDITVITPSNAGVRRRTRRAAVICAVAVASALWAVIEPGFGLDLRGPLLGTAETMDVGLAHVVSGSLGVRWRETMWSPSAPPSLPVLPTRRRTGIGSNLPNLRKQMVRLKQL